MEMGEPVVEETEQRMAQALMAQMVWEVVVEAQATTTQEVRVEMGLL